MDFSKAFDTVPYHRLLHKLSHYGINGKTNTWISSFLQDRHQRVVVGGEHSKWVKVKSGVPQGTVLGPLLFLLYINDLPDNISSRVRLFADDCVLYLIITSDHDAARLQDDLNKLAAWEQKWQMKFNLQKCFVLRITNSKSPIINQYTLGGTVLQETTSHSYLGVEISQDLKWDKHISKITTSANKINGFIRRNLKSCTRDTKSSAYTTLVRPIIEYSSSVWDPHTNEHIHELGKIQRRAARSTCNDYRRTTSATELIRGLGWDLLSTRRKISRVSVLHKAIGGHLALPVSDYLRPTTRTTRRSSPNSYIQPQTRLNGFKNSFVPRTIKDWNSLPANIQSTEDNIHFKQLATEFFRIQDKDNRD